MRILLIQENEELRDRVHFALESTYGATVTEAGSFKETLDLLKSPDSQFDLIIYDFQAPPKDALKSLLSAKPTTPFLVCVPGSASDKEASAPNLAGKIERAALIQGLADAIDGMIAAGKLPKPSIDEKYCRIRTKLLLSVCPLKGDIFIRLSEWKFVKLFREGDVFDLNDLEKYMVKKGIEYLYLRTEQSKEFVEKYTADLRKMLSGPALGIEEASKAGETAFEAVQELGRRVGFTREVQELAKTQIQVTLKSIGRSPKLSEMINKMKNAKGQYIASHSTMCAYLACAIASQMKWGSDTTFLKLNLASFLHDISLHNQELAACETLADLAKPGASFTDEEIKAFKNHPVKSAEISRQFSEVPADVDTIILQHHERPDGSGFPRGLAQAYIAPLTAVFIVAHDLARQALADDGALDMHRYLQGARDRYKGGQFKKVLAAMEST